MAKIFEGGEKLFRGAEFALQEQEDGIFFVQSSGQKVQTDEVGRNLWENLPSKASDIVLRVKTKVLASEGFLEQYLFILAKAGIIRTSRHRGDKEPGAGPIPSGNDLPDQHLISAIIITYNGESHIRECLESLLFQTYKNLEILVVDNASKDNTVRIIQENYPGANVFSLKRNRHFARAVNFGIDHVRGKHFLVLNQDVALEKNCLAELYSKMQSGERIGAVVPMMKFYHLRGFINGIGNQVQDHGWGSDNFIGLVDVGQFKELAEVPSACFGAVLLNREAIHDSGKLDGGYKSFYEDVDWSFRCWFRGWKIVAAPDAVLYHKFGGSYLGDKKLRFIVGNRIRLVLKAFQGRLLLGFLKQYFKEDIKCLLAFVKGKKYGSLAAYIRGYFSLLLSLPAICCKRLRILRRKRKGFKDKDILAKNPSFFSGLNDHGQPVIDTSMIFGYYKWEI